MHSRNVLQSNHDEKGTHDGFLQNKSTDRSLEIKQIKILSNRLSVEDYVTLSKDEKEERLREQRKRAHETYE